MNKTLNRRVPTIIILIIIIVSILVFAFYWFEYRVSKIKSFCENKAVSSLGEFGKRAISGDYSEILNLDSVNEQVQRVIKVKESTYESCLRSKGV